MKGDFLLRSKIKIRKDQKLGKTVIDYYKSKDKNKFRYNALKELIKEEKLFVIINTNLCSTIQDKSPKENIKEIEEFIKDKEFRSCIIPIENTNKRSIFGIAIDKNNVEPAYKLAFIIPEKMFDNDIYNTILSIYDIELGIGFVKEEDEILEDFRRGYINSCYDKDYFSNAIFNGVVFDKITTDLEVNSSIINIG